MGQQVADANGCFTAVRQPRPEVRQPSRHRVVEPDSSLLDEPHCGDGDDRLGDGGKPEDGVFAHRQTAFAVGKAGGTVMDDLSVAGDKHHRSHKPFVVESTCDGRIDRCRKRRIRVGVCHIQGKTHQIKPSIITMTVPEYRKPLRISRVIIVKNSQDVENSITRRRGRPPAFDRETVLSAARETFWEHGYEGASIADLTAAMGITPQSLYAAFNSKADLYRAALEQYRGLGADTFPRSASRSTPSPPSSAYCGARLRFSRRRSIRKAA